MEQISIFDPRQKFIELAYQTDRKGIESVIDWLDNETDFFTAPSSSRYHGACEGGLVNHSLKVYCRLRDLAPEFITHNSIIISSLFHDVCKANFYTISTRNVKNKETGKWETAPYYAIDEKFPYGAHGGKSVYLLMKHGLELTDDEAIAINNHMGGWDYTAYHNPSKAFDQCPLALFLHIADLIAANYDHQ